MRHLVRLFIPVMLMLGASTAQAGIDPELNQIIKLLVDAGITDTTPDSNPDAGKQICRAGNGSYCSTVSGVGEGICKALDGNYCTTVTSIGEGICKAGDGNYCNTVTGVGEGICKAGGGNYCSSVSSIGEGICKARRGNFCTGMSAARALSIPIEDTEWAWDQFYNDQYDLIWRCRGKQTGQFAPDQKCQWDIRADTTWPGY